MSEAPFREVFDETTAQTYFPDRVEIHATNYPAVAGLSLIACFLTPVLLYAPLQILNPARVITDVEVSILFTLSLVNVLTIYFKSLKRFIVHADSLGLECLEADKNFESVNGLTWSCQWNEMRFKRRFLSTFPVNRENQFLPAYSCTYFGHTGSKLGTLIDLLKESQSDEPSRLKAKWDSLYRSDALEQFRKKTHYFAPTAARSSGCRYAYRFQTELWEEPRLTLTQLGLGLGILSIVIAMLRLPNSIRGSDLTWWGCTILGISLIVVGSVGWMKERKELKVLLMDTLEFPSVGNLIRYRNGTVKDYKLLKVGEQKHWYMYRFMEVHELYINDAGEKYRVDPRYLEEM